MRAPGAWAGLLVLVLAGAPSLEAAGLRTWVEPPAELTRGSAEGMAMTERGRLFLAPQLVRVGGFSGGGSEPAQVWSAVADGEGNIFLGTGPDGTVLRISRSGKQEIWFQLDEPLVTALAPGRGGSLMAAGSPGGRIYRITAAGRGEVWAEVEETYVWSLSEAANGKLYAGTGDRGRVIEIDRDGEWRPWFDADEAHVTSVAAAPAGLLAGGAGRGLVYTFDDESHGQVLHDDELMEVAALAVDAGGGVLAALAAPAERRRRRPMFELRMPDGSLAGMTGDSVTGLDEADQPRLQGVIEGLGSSGTGGGGTRGRVVRVDPAGGATELWSSSREIPLCIATDPQGRVVFGTGEPARLYRVEPDGDVALLWTSREAQLSRLVSTGGALYAATSNPAALYRVEPAAAELGLYVSRPFDAGAPARWGALRWTVEAGDDRVELTTRTGNSAVPDATWSGWSPAMTDAAGSTIDNPDGRFLQWRLRSRSRSAGSTTRVSAVTVAYEPYNRPPRLDEFRVDGPGPVASGPITFLWSVWDPDEDAVAVLLEYRPASSSEWKLAARNEPQATGGVGASRQIGRAVWETADLAEGDYRVRAIASDQPGNAYGESHRVEAPASLPVAVDRTPPRLELRPRSAAGEYEVTIEDSHSIIRRLELLEDGNLRMSPRPVDGLCESRSETFHIELPRGADPSAWTLRGVDAAGNVVERPLDESGGR